MNEITKGSMVVCLAPIMDHVWGYGGCSCGKCVPLFRIMGPNKEEYTIVSDLNEEGDLRFEEYPDEDKSVFYPKQYFKKVQDPMDPNEIIEVLTMIV